MSVKGTVLENYRFDIRDFSARQIDVLKKASASGKGNKELKRKLHDSIYIQERNRKKYFKKVALEKRRAYMKKVYENLRERLHIPIGVSDWLVSANGKFDKFTQSLLPGSWSLYGQDTMQWHEIKIDEHAGHLPHVVAGMPANCVHLSGWERVKQAFFPSFYMEMFDPHNPTHTFNTYALAKSTILLSSVTGAILGIDYAQRDLAKYKKHEGTVLYESRMMGKRVRDSIYMRSLLKYAIRWGWRIGFLYVVTYGISQSMTIYKLKDKSSHYIIGLGAATAMYAWKSGPTGMLMNGLLGALLGVPLGVCMGTLGFNPRPLHYYSHVEPLVTGPMSEQGMSLEEQLVRTERTIEILNLLQSAYSPEINNDDFYREFAGKQNDS